MAEVYCEAAPAKVNLALHVTGRRPDHYHDLHSLVVFADVADELEAVPAGADTLNVVGPFAEGLTGSGNLVLRAVAAFRQRWPGIGPRGLALKLQKNLPVAAGLGGGSADAAAALRLMANLAPDPIPPGELLALAARLGADVPACLLSRPCEVRGIGEIVVPLETFPPCHLVLVNPMRPLVTAEVFRALEHHQQEPLPALPDPLTRPAQLAVWLGETRNDLEPAALKLVPEIGALVSRMARAQGCVLARMSGSGASVFGLFGAGAQAHEAAHEMRAAFPDYWIAAAPVIPP